MRKVSDTEVAKILEALPGTVSEIALKIGLPRNTTWRWLEQFRGVLWHIHKQVVPSNGGPLANFYAVGPDAPEHGTYKHKPLGSKGRTDKYRKALKRSGEYEDVKAKQRAYYWKSRLPKPHPLMSLFGDPNVRSKTPNKP